MMVALLGACSQGQDTPEVDYDTLLPAGWEAIGAWQEVNIDGDEPPEYLLLFTYEAGQAGATIYDAQISAPVVGVVQVSATPAATPTVALIQAPVQPVGYFIPYGLFPSAWAFTYGEPAQVGHGYVAAPADAQNIAVTQVNYEGRPPPGMAPSATSVVSGTTYPTGEVLLRGGNTLLTFVWWKGAPEGYGVTQVAAAGGWQGIDWEGWEKKPSVIQSLRGLYPLEDYRARSLLCRVVDYTRAGDAPGIEYAPHELGIQFCPATVPTSPYYPEGVVTAYLLWSGVGGHAQDRGAQAGLLAPGAASDQVAVEAGAGRLANERIDDIVTYPTVAVTVQGLMNEGPAPTTTVCVELAELADPRYRRWLLFTLQYQPPNLQTDQAERWAILGASLTPAPVQEESGSYCATILGE